MGGNSGPAQVIQRVVTVKETPKPAPAKEKKPLVKKKKGREATRKTGPRGVLTSATLGRPALTAGNDTLG